MSKKMRFVLFALALLCVASAFVNCGGGGSGSGSTNPPPPPPTTYTVGTDIDTGVASITPTSRTVNAGQTAQYVFVVKSTHTLDNATCAVGGSYVVNTDGSYTYTTNAVQAADTVRIRTKEKKTYLLSTSVIGNGRFEPSELRVEEGKSAIFTLIANAGSYLDHAYGNGATLSGNTLTIPAVSADDTLFARFMTPGVPFALFQVKVNPQVLAESEWAQKAVVVKAHAHAPGLRLYVEYASQFFNNRDAAVDMSIELKDDGVSPDTVSGDGEYAGAFTFSNSPAFRYYSGRVAQIPMYIRAKDMQGNVVQEGTGFITGLSMIALKDGALTSIETVASDVFATSHAVNVVLPRFVYYSQYREMIAKRIYTYYPDAFEHLVYAYVGNTDRENISKSSAVKTAAGGLNLDPSYDISGAFGSSGKLQTVLRILSGDLLFGVFNHELGHSVATYYNKDTLDLTQKKQDPGQGSVHPASIGTHIGQMGGTYLLEKQLSGDYKILLPVDGYYEHRECSLLEKYQLGLIDGSQLGEQAYIPEPVDLGAFVPNQIVPSSVVRSYTIQDLQAVYGVRPLRASSEFRVLFVGISERPLSQAEISYLTLVGQHFSSTAGLEKVMLGDDAHVTPRSFHSATSGLGSMTTVVPSKK